MWGEKMKKDDKGIIAYMGEDVVFNGSLSFEGTVRIDGKFEGEINTDDTLIVGETGHIVADVYAGAVICKGCMEGTIVATKKIEIHANSRVVGNVKSPALYIELGGIFDGSCEMIAKESKVIPLVKAD
jgi:cytoskeletal protein CcmA (bactofilin family)